MNRVRAVAFVLERSIECFGDVIWENSASSTHLAPLQILLSWVEWKRWPRVCLGVRGSAVPGKAVHKAEGERPRVGTLLSHSSTKGALHTRLLNKHWNESVTDAILKTAVWLLWFQQTWQHMQVMQLRYLCLWNSLHSTFSYVPDKNCN